MRGQLADLNLINDPQNIGRFREFGPAEYMPHAYRPELHHPRTGIIDKNLTCDLAFVGTAFKSRIAFFEAMDLSGLDVLVAGNDWGSLPEDSPMAPFVGTGIGNPDCINNDQTAEIYRNAKFGINFYRQETEEGGSAVGMACGPREIEMAACGLPFLRDPRPESDELFPMLPTFDGPEDASEKLRWWLAHDRERQLAADKARLAVADRTFDRNVKRFLTLVDDL